MKILTISTAFPWPADDGTKIQTFERVRALSAKHHVTLLCISSELISSERMNEMGRFCRCVCFTTPSISPPTSPISKLRQLLRSCYYSVPYYVHDAFSMPAQEWLVNECRNNDVDVVEADGYANAYLCVRLAALKVAIFHSVVATCASKERAFADGCARKLTIAAYRALTLKYEAKVVRNVDLCVTLTEASRTELQRLYPAATVRNSVSNGVDGSYYSYAAPALTSTAACFVGKMDYAPNVDAVVWFCREVLPLVRAQIPDFRFSIVGSHPTEVVQALVRYDGVIVTGYVDDVRPYIRDSGTVVLPLRMGGGILNKLLQSFALGVPVVATSLALEGVAAVPGRDLLIADTPRDLADSIVRAALEGGLRVRLAESARRYVERAHRWDTMATRYETDLVACVLERRSKQCANKSVD